jgi:hypothetical protein
LRQPFAAVAAAGWAAAEGLAGGHAGADDTVGVVGWKWFGPDEVDDPATALDIPAFLADPLRGLRRGWRTRPT